MRHTLQGIDSRITGKRISQLKDRMMEITATEQNKENKKKKKRNEDSLKHLFDNIKCSNICTTVILEKEKRNILTQYFKRFCCKLP